MPLYKKIGFYLTQAYLRARYYDPTTGRFTSEDPAKDGLNWYVYCGNNPINRWDPTGGARTDEDQATYEALGGFWSSEARAFKQEIDEATKDWNNANGDIINENNAAFRAAAAPIHFWHSKQPICAAT